MFRVVEWCGIDGFDAWWTRFARETNEDMLQSGPIPEIAISWPFDHRCGGPRDCGVRRSSLEGDYEKRRNLANQSAGSSGIVG